MKKQNKRVNTPSKEWFNQNRILSIDYHLIENLLDDIDSKLYEVSCHLDDPEFVQRNYPSYSNMEMEEFIEMDYKEKSSFIKNLRNFIKKEWKINDEKYKEFSEDEQKWFKSYREIIDFGSDKL